MRGSMNVTVTITVLVSETVPMAHTTQTFGEGPHWLCGFTPAVSRFFRVLVHE